MIKNLNNNLTSENLLYNNILLLSRNKFFYTKFGLSDTFQNRIHLIFVHIGFLFIKIKHDKDGRLYKSFYQKTFDLIFSRIELNMREIGYGDVTVNKNMKILVKNFYDILLNCEDFMNKSENRKNIFFSTYLNTDKDQNMANISALIKYFDKYQAFCFDLTSDSVLQGNLKFNY